MDPDVRNMLEQMYEILFRKIHDKRIAWNCLLEFLALDNSGQYLLEVKWQITEVIQNPELLGNLSRIYDRKLLASDYYDHLGEIYFEKCENQIYESTPNNLLPIDESQRIAEKAVGDDTEIKTVMDRKVSTGRLLMAVHKIAPNVILFGMESDIQLYQIALVNMAIHNIPAFLICASENNSKQRFENTGLQEWKQANQWNGDRHSPDLRENQQVACPGVIHQ